MTAAKHETGSRYRFADRTIINQLQQVWIPPPRNVSGALANRSPFSAASSSTCLPSSRVTRAASPHRHVCPLQEPEYKPAACAAGIVKLIDDFDFRICHKLFHRVRFCRPNSSARACARANQYQHTLLSQTLDNFLIFVI